MIFIVYRYLYGFNSAPLQGKHIFGRKHSDMISLFQAVKILDFA